MMHYPTINRSVLLVKPKQPFYNWSNALSPGLPKTNANDLNEYNSYLLEDELFLDDPKTELKTYWIFVFLNELIGQWTDENDYPKLSWKLFIE